MFAVLAQLRESIVLTRNLVTQRDVIVELLKHILGRFGEKGQTSLQPISPKLGNSHPNNADRQIAIWVRAKVRYVFLFLGQPIHLKFDFSKKRTKVNEFDPSMRRQQDVVAFDVSVDGLVDVQVLQALCRQSG